jgi:hypothetical protein
VTIERAKKFAMRQGYRWVPNPDADIPFDAFVYRENDIIAVRAGTCRDAPGDDDLFQEFFRKNYEILQMLPLPDFLPRELWVRYSWSRVFHRFRMTGSDLLETVMIDRDLPVFPRHTPFSVTSDEEGEGRNEVEK